MIKNKAAKSRRTTLKKNTGATSQSTTVVHKKNKPIRQSSAMELSTPQEEPVQSLTIQIPQPQIVQMPPPKAQFVEKRRVIGEGSYGCVHKPSLECVEPNFNYVGVVSKIMPKSEAENELKEFEKIDSLDPGREFHLGKPDMCRPKLGPRVLRDIGQCKSVDANKVKLNPDNYRLLLMKNGGPNLDDLKNLVLNSNTSSAYFKNNSDSLQENRSSAYFINDANVQNLFIEMRKLLQGVKVLRANRLIHHDLKPHNILLNTDTGKLSMIDFGLLVSYEDFKARCEQNKNETLGIFHWNFPFECAFSNRANFDAYVNQRQIMHSQKKVFSTLKTFISFIYEVDKISAEVQQQLFNSYFASLNRHISQLNNDYDAFINFLMDSIDVYGLGLSLIFLLLEVRKQTTMYKDKCSNIIGLFRDICSLYPDTRLTDIDEIIRRYDGF